MAPLYTSAWVDAATLAKMSGKDLQRIIDLNDAMQRIFSGAGHPKNTCSAG